jgi:chromosome partitioning protein
MKVIVFGNQKGGTGKTTTAIKVGDALARTGKRVLLIDLDPQGAMPPFHSTRNRIPGWPTG